jgi:hypothetical protein
MKVNHQPHAPAAFEEEAASTRVRPKVGLGAVEKRKSPYLELNSDFSVVPLHFK